MILFLWMAVAAAAPQTIHYESSGRSFDLVLTSDQLILRNEQRSQVVNLSSCNSELVKRFWSTTTAQVQALPTAADGNFPPWLSYEGRFYLLPPHPGGHFKTVRQLDAKFATFKSREQRLCGKKRS